MSDNQGILSPENLRTIVVVTFVLTLFAVVFNFYNYARTSQVAQGVIDLETADLASDTSHKQTVTALESQIADLQKKVADLEAAAAAAAPPAGDAAAAAK